MGVGQKCSLIDECELRPSELPDTGTAAFGGYLMVTCLHQDKVLAILSTIFIGYDNSLLTKIIAAVSECGNISTS